MADKENWKYCPSGYCPDCGMMMAPTMSGGVDGWHICRPRKGVHNEFSDNKSIAVQAVIGMALAIREGAKDEKLWIERYESAFQLKAEIIRREGNERDKRIFGKALYETYLNCKAQCEGCRAQGLGAKADKYSSISQSYLYASQFWGYKPEKDVPKAAVESQDKGGSVVLQIKATKKRRERFEKKAKEVKDENS